MKRNGEANPYSIRPKESAHVGHPPSNITMHHSNLDSNQDHSSSHGYHAHQPSHHAAIIRSHPSSYPHPHPATNNSHSHLPLPPPPPGPPPPLPPGPPPPLPPGPPPPVQSILKNTSPTRQPRSKLFQRFAQDQPQPKEKQRRSKLFQRSSLTLQLKPPPPPPPQPHLTQHPEQPLSQLTSKNLADHDSHHGAVTNDGQPENASGKPKAFQSQDQALKALKQRRRAKAVEAWKGKISDGEVGKKDDTISEAVLDTSQDIQQTSTAGTEGGMNGGANGQVARTTQGGTVEPSSEKEEGGGNPLSTKSSTSINWTGEDDLSEDGEVVDDSMSMSESDEEDTHKKSTKSDTPNTNTKDTLDMNIQVRGPVTKEHEQDDKQASIHPSPMRLVMQEESKEATTNDSDLIDTDDEAEGDHSAVIQEPTELKRAQSNPSIPPVHIPPRRLVNKQPPKEGASSTQSSRDDGNNSGEKSTGLIRARSNPVQRSKEHLKRAQNAMGEVQQKSKRSIVPETVSERTEGDSYNNKANVDSIKRLRKMSKASLSKLSSIKRKSSEETAENDDGAMGDIAELEAVEHAQRERNKSSKKRKRQKGLSFDLTQSLSATVAKTEAEFLSESGDKKKSPNKKRKKGDSSKLSRPRMLLSFDVDDGIASRNDVSGFSVARKGSTKSHSSRSNSPIPSDAEKVEPATTRRRSTRSERKETTDKQASKVLPAKNDQKSSKKARRKTHSRANVTAGANEATIINSNNSSKQSNEQKQNNLSAARKPHPNEVPYNDKDGYTNSIVHPKSLSEHNVDESMPLMDLWRKERRKKKKSGNTTRLFLSNGAAANDNANICNGNRRKTKKRRQLFRHRLVLPEFRSPGASNVNSVGGDCGNEGGCYQQQPEQKVKAKVAAQKVLAFQYDDSLWDHSWDDESDEEDETKVDIDVVDLLQVSSRKLPFSDTPVWNPRISDGAGASKSKNAKDSSGKEVPNRLHSLRERIEKADAAIQSKAPSSIEFGAKRWIDKKTASSPVARGSYGNSDMRGSAQRLPNQQSNKTFIRRDQQSFFSVPPRAKPYTSSNSAQEFLTLLHSMASEAVAASGSSPASSANAVVMEFLTIVRESRVNPPPTPFHLMKKVWALISTVAAGCKQDGTPGRANELAAKFDAFLPEGYSMVSSNLLILENIQGAHSKVSQALEVGGECARTHEPFIGSLKTG